MNIKSTTYVATLPEEQQEEIEEALKKRGLNGEALDDAMNSRLCDLSL